MLEREFCCSLSGFVIQTRLFQSETFENFDQLGARKLNPLKENRYTRASTAASERNHYSFNYASSLVRMYIHEHVTYRQEFLENNFGVTLQRSARCVPVHSR
jgi:hypothetical protein